MIMHLKSIVLIVNGFYGGPILGGVGNCEKIKLVFTLLPGISEIAIQEQINRIEWEEK
jgi:hypothetical protein